MRCYDLKYYRKQVFTKVLMRQPYVYLLRMVMVKQICLSQNIKSTPMANRELKIVDLRDRAEFVSGRDGVKAFLRFGVDVGADDFSDKDEMIAGGYL
jgi:hypothetical protein